MEGISAEQIKIMELKVDKKILKHVLKKRCIQFENTIKQLQRERDEYRDEYYKLLNNKN